MDIRSWKVKAFFGDLYLEETILARGPMRAALMVFDTIKEGGKDPESVRELHIELVPLPANAPA